MVELLNENLRKPLRQLWDPFIMKMIEYKKDVFSIDDWIEAFSHVGNTAVRDESKATLWAQPNTHSSN